MSVERYVIISCDECWSVGGEVPLPQEDHLKSALREKGWFVDDKTNKVVCPKHSMFTQIEAGAPVELVGV